jgi:acyl carrier protein
MEVSLSKLNEIFSSAFDCQIDLNPNTKKEDVEQWDSINHLNLIVELSDSFDINFSPEEIEKITSIESLINILKDK